MKAQVIYTSKDLELSTDANGELWVKCMEMDYCCGSPFVDEAILALFNFIKMRANDDLIRQKQEARNIVNEMLK